MDNRFLFCSYKVTGLKFPSHPDNNTFFLLMVLVILEILTESKEST